MTTVSFSNPAGTAAADAGDYTRALLALLGDRDPLTVLAEMPAALADGVRRAGAELARPEAPGKWSVLEVVAHMADSELVWAYRMRRVLTEDRPPIRGYDQDRWADRLRYRDADAAIALALFAAVRASNLRLLRGLAPADLERIGMHEERGAESVAHLMKLVAAHDLVHRRQIDRILATVGQ